jgi:nitrite reductase/ring-hydroxylating ferredoxin subunit
MTERLLPPGNRAPVRVLAGLEALDAPAKKIGKAVRTLIKPGPLKDALSGSWLGHALHPLLTDVTIGSYTSAVALDWLGGRESQPAARRLIGLGLLSTLPTVSSGYSDWADTEVSNESVRRVGVDHAVFEDGPEEWTAVLDDADLRDGQMRCVEADGTAVMVARAEGALYALSEHCSHRGGPLHEGEISDGTVRCPWHDSVFDLRDGALVHGPAAYPQPAWDTRVREGRIEVRRR